MAKGTHHDEDSTATRRLDGGQVLPVRERDRLTGRILLGRYRVGVLLGQGGMGTVYMAEQLQPVQRTVALKLLARTRMDARRRSLFELERQMLARMQHPAIAQIFDAGTTEDGIPFFAMEYIDGIPVTEFAQRQGLDLRQRLNLFLKVCDGVQHAHQKGVIHRDLKPMNMLVAAVDGQPQAKIIDFGIALVAANVGADGDEAVAGTPSYMSPEQLLGEGSQIDTRTDVYSLGIVLYQLLTGIRPDAPSATRGDGGDPAPTLLPPSRQLDQLAHGGDPALKALQRPLRDELDHVVLRAAHADRGQRYPSVLELAADVRRFLDGLPVNAAPQTRRYLAGKFVRRHRVPLLAAVVGVVAVIAGLLVSLYGLRQAQEQRGIAERRQVELEQVVAFQQSMLKDLDVHALGQGILDEQMRAVAGSDDDGSALRDLERLRPRLGASDVARAVIGRFILERADATIARDFTRQPAMAADLRMTIGEVYFAIGLYQPAAEAFRAAWQARGDALGPDHIDTVLSLLRLGATQDRLGQTDQALDSLRQVRAQLAEHHRDDLVKQGEADQVFAWLLAAKGDFTQARAILEQAAERLRQTGNADVEADSLPAILNTLGGVQNRMGDPQAARASLEESLAERERLLGEDHPNVTITRMNLSNVYARLGEHERALALVRDAHERQLRIFGARHPVTLMALNNMADSLRELGRHEEALAGFQEVVRVRSELLGSDHQDTLRARQNVANTLTLLGRHEQALEAHYAAYEARRRVLGDDHQETLLSQSGLAAACLQQSRLEEARRHAEAVIAHRGGKRAVADRHVLANLQVLAEINRRQGREAEALALLQDLLRNWRAQGDDGDEDLAQEAAFALVRLQHQRGDVAAAAQIHAEFLQPLLVADDTQLTPRQQALRQNLLGQD